MASRVNSNPSPPTPVPHSLSTATTPRRSMICDLVNQGGHERSRRRLLQRREHDGGAPWLRGQDSARDTSRPVLARGASIHSLARTKPVQPRGRPHSAAPAGQGILWRDATLGFNPGGVFAAYLQRKGFLGIGRIKTNAKMIHEVRIKDDNCKDQQKLLSTFAWSNGSRPCVVTTPRREGHPSATRRSTFEPRSKGSPRPSNSWSGRSGSNCGRRSDSRVSLAVATKEMDPEGAPMRPATSLESDTFNSMRTVGPCRTGPAHVRRGRGRGVGNG
jgi:hypothetical protein